MAVSSKRLKLCNFKLDVLLEITRAINENLSTSKLLKRYEEILKQNLNIGKIVIFKKSDKKWENILQSGFEEDLEKVIDVEKDLLQYNDIEFISNTPVPGFESFDILIPVFNNDQAMAYVLIGDIDEDVEGISPALKHLHFIQTLSNIILVAIENIRLHHKSIKQESLRKELELASRMQTMLIPDRDSLPKNEYVSVEAYYNPHFEIGGDYYDVVQLDEDTIGFCIADVSGKGISAALLMSNFQANVKALFSSNLTVPDMIGILNNRVMLNAKGEKFITLFLGKYNWKERKLQYVNAGHNPPILYQADKKELSFLSKGCVGMGMLDEIPIVKMGEHQVTERTKLFCYTDGLVELMDEEESVDVGTKAIEQDLSNDGNIKDNIDAIIKSHKILEGSTRVFDDISILGLEFFA